MDCSQFEDIASPTAATRILRVQPEDLDYVDFDHFDHGAEEFDLETIDH